MLKKIAVIIFASYLVWTTCQAWCATDPQDVRTELDTRVDNYDVTAKSFVEGLVQVASDFSVPMGIEWVNAAPARRKLSLHWQRATVEDVLDAIVRSQPGYEIQVYNGVVHVRATGVPSTEDFLSLHIKSFAVHNEVLQLAERRLRDQVRVQVTWPENKSGGTGGSLATAVGEPGININELVDVTVQDVLDAFVLASRKKIWIVTFSEDSAPTRAGYRRTMTLWNNSRVPDEEQPVWDMFAWHEQVPSVRLIGD